ncbi:MAG TPA: hypothetical protein VLE53_09045 [Gemmatimonadaceae bacterium]|nr:hypothetical protein [Gemmatimonadaceae bacterium]
MGDGGEAPGSELGDAELSRARTIGVGCFSTFVGFWSGGMIGVLVGRIIGSARNCAPPEGLPACDWYWYAAGGMLVGATTLPLFVLRRLRGRDRAGRP